MPSEITPTEADIRAQLQHMLRNPLFARIRKRDGILLKLLGDVWLAGSEAVDKAELLEKYKAAGGKSTMTIVTLGGRVGQVRRTLKEYYSPPTSDEEKTRHAGEEDRFQIGIAENDWTPVFTPLTGRAADAAVEKGILKIANNSDKAMIYVASQLLEEGASSVLNTHVRFGRSGVYHKDTYEPLCTALKEFLSRGCTWEDLLGIDLDPSYYKRLVEGVLASDYPENYIPSQIKNVFPLMNFLILNYDDSDSEVLFGWGRAHRGKQTGVFSSKDPEVVQSFREFFTFVSGRFARKITLSELLEQMKALEEQQDDERNEP